MVAHPTRRLSSAISAPEGASCLALAAASQAVRPHCRYSGPWTEPSFAVTSNAWMLRCPPCGPQVLIAVILASLCQYGCCHREQGDDERGRAVRRPSGRGNLVVARTGKHRRTRLSPLGSTSPFRCLRASPAQRCVRKAGTGPQKPHWLQSPGAAC